MDPNHGDGTAPMRPRRWRLWAALRLTVLLAVLGVVSWYAVEENAGGRASVNRSQSAGQGQPADLTPLGPQRDSTASPYPFSLPATPVAADCALPSTPAPRAMSIAALEATARSTGFAKLNVAGTPPNVYGLATPRLAVRDGAPTIDPATVPAAQLVPGGFELRWWDDDFEYQVADLFVFSSHVRAQAFVRAFATRRCHSSATFFSGFGVPGARGLGWDMQKYQGAEADLVFSRGRNAYRFADVYTTNAGDPTEEDLQVPTEAACELPSARCAPG